MLVGAAAEHCSPPAMADALADAARPNPMSRPTPTSAAPHKLATVAIFDEDGPGEDGGGLFWRLYVPCQARVAPADVDPPRVRSRNRRPAGTVPIATLAAESISAHLMDARRRCCLHVVVTASTTTTALKFPVFAASTRPSDDVRDRDVREIHAKSPSVILDHAQCGMEIGGDSARFGTLAKGRAAGSFPPSARRTAALLGLHHAVEKVSPRSTRFGGARPARKRRRREDGSKGAADS